MRVWNARGAGSPHLGVSVQVSPIVCLCVCVCVGVGVCGMPGELDLLISGSLCR